MRDYVMSDSRDDETPVVLDQDQKALFKKASEEILGALGWLQDSQNGRGDKLTVSIRSTAMSVLEMYVTNLGNALGYPTDIEARRVADMANIRSANARIRELESQLADRLPPDALKGIIDRVHQTISKFWDNLGFTLVKITLGRCVISLEFCITIDQFAPTFSEKPVTEQREKYARVTEMIESGLEVVQVRGDGPAVLDTPGNRAWILTEIRKQFPSFSLFKWDSVTIRDKNDNCQLRHLEGHLDYSDLGSILEDKEG